MAMPSDLDQGPGNGEVELFQIRPSFKYDPLSNTRLFQIRDSFKYGALRIMEPFKINVPRVLVQTPSPKSGDPNLANVLSNSTFDDSKSIIADRYDHFAF